MKKIIALAVAFAAVAIAGSDANAQSFSFNNGYQFGAGNSAANCNAGFGFGTYFGRGMATRQARPPYFAEFPPVYYSGIVRRPYGISPYAAPAGVMPVEMSQAIAPTEPIVVKNPFFNQNNAEPVSVVENSEKELESTKNKSTKNKSTKIINPFFGTPLESALMVQASFDADQN